MEYKTVSDSIEKFSNIIMGASVIAVIFELIGWLINISLATFFIMILAILATLFSGWVWSNIFSGFASIVLSTGETSSVLKENKKLLSEIESKISSVNNDKSSSYTNDNLPTM